MITNQAIRQAWHAPTSIAHHVVNTAQTHLAHVYRKLGIRSRWQLTIRDDLHQP